LRKIVGLGVEIPQRFAQPPNREGILRPHDFSTFR
jgi:hypothetical protein